MEPNLALEVVSHHLLVFGTQVDSLRQTDVLLMANPDIEATQSAGQFALAGGMVVALTPKQPFCVAFGVDSGTREAQPPVEFTLASDGFAAWSRLRTLHPANWFRHPNGAAVVVGHDRQAAWLWLPMGGGGILFVGTDLAEDLVRYRQGDPARAIKGATGELWGYAGERPNYLFEDQLAGENPGERHADWWCIALVQEIKSRTSIVPAPILPEGVQGAVVITGDDDQAYLEKYSEQLQLLGETPITYFLHPLTRHTTETLRKMLDHHRIDLGIHPDALERPDQYVKLLREQVTWYRKITGTSPLSVRNHGFLNDGYWGHLPAWLREGIRLSSNLPGLDGRVLNGSLLPARLVYGNALTNHWSLLTAIGDGVRFVSGMSDRQAGQCVLDFADQIRHSRLPGIVVLNLHPQNIGETRSMHEAAIEIIKSGFHPWTVRECLAWFERHAIASESDTHKRQAPFLQRIWKHLKREST